MKKLINYEIKTLSQILEDISKLEPNEELEKSLKENKYIKEITNNYFNIDENIIETINRHLSLTKELKENHIKLTDKQKEQELKYKDYIKKIEETLESVIRLLKQLEKETTYIDLEIINILKLNEIDDLKKVIEYNQRITLKRKGMLQEVSEKEQDNPGKIKIEPVKEQKAENTLLEAPIEEKIIEEEPEKILMFNSIEEINKHLKEKYNITIKTEKELEELNKILEILESKEFDKIKSEEFKKLLEEGTEDSLYLIRDLIKNSGYNYNDLKHIDKLLSKDKIEFILAYEIYKNEASSEEEKEKLMNKSIERKKIILRNVALLTTYDIFDFPLTALLKPLSLEKIEQFTEIGNMKELYIAEKIYKRSNLVKEIQLEECLSNAIYPYACTQFYAKRIYEIPLLPTIEIRYIKNGTFEEPSEIKELKLRICQQLKKDNKISPLISDDKINLEQYISSKPILRAQEITSKKSQEEFLDTLIPYWEKDSNPIYKEQNKYLEALENKYSSDKAPFYTIPVKKSLCKAGSILISKNKVVRLLNQHLIEKHEITKEIIKECIMYNLIITDDLLKELDRKITELFNKVDEKSQKKLKSIK